MSSVFLKSKFIQNASMKQARLKFPMMSPAGLYRFKWALRRLKSWNDLDFNPNAGTFSQVKDINSVRKALEFETGENEFC